MTIAYSIIGLGVLIFVHELGHFIASLVLGMRPRRFYVGFPPAIWKTTRNGIEYGLGAVPLGGFVKIPGMHRPAPVDVDVGLGRVVSEVPTLEAPTARLRGALAAGDHDTARDAVRVLRGLLDEHELEPRIEQAARKGIDDLDDSLGPTAYWRAATWKRVAVIAAGPVANVVLAVVVFAVLFMTFSGRATTSIAEVAPGTPAAAAGLQSGDTIVSIDGNPVEAETVSRPIVESDGAPVTLVVTRAGERITLRPARPELVDGIYRLGFALQTTGLPPLDASREAIGLTWRVTKVIGESLGRLVTGEGRNELASPVGIVRESSNAAEESATSFFYVLGLISLSVALINLLPLLPLDGGHIVFAIAEGVRGRSVRRTLYERASLIGIGIVVVLFVVGLSNDIDRLT